MTRPFFLLFLSFFLKLYVHLYLILFDLSPIFFLCFRHMWAFIHSFFNINRQKTWSLLLLFGGINWATVLSYFIQLHRIIMIFSLQSRTFKFKFLFVLHGMKGPEGIYIRPKRTVRASLETKENIYKTGSNNRSSVHHAGGREKFYPCVLSCCAQDISVDVAAQRWLPFTTTNDRRATPRPYTHHVSISLSIYPSYILYRSQGAEAGAIKERRHRVQLPIDWIASSSCIHMYYIEKEEGKKSQSNMMNGRHTKNNRDWLRALTGLTFPIHQQNIKKLGERELLKELYIQHIYTWMI